MNAIPTDVFERIVALRRDIHQHPELSWQEERTATRIEEHLRGLGLEPRRLAATGVVADVAGEQDGDSIALRADTDALPVLERTGLPFASVHAGAMHACGHDAHTAMLMGAAELLVASPPPLPVRLIWQPAEEEGNGAPTLIEAGVLEGVGLVFGGHVDHRYDVGTIIVTDGAVNASTDTIRITIEGRSGHGARPHEAVDSVVVGSMLVIALQTLVSREIDPARPAVLSIGRFEAGTASNIIAGHAHLEGTIRTHDDSVRELLRQGLVRVCNGVAELHGAQITPTMEPGLPPVINSPEATTLAREVAVVVAGADQVTTLETANMGGEDFAYYLHHVPGCYVRFGCRSSGVDWHPAHSDRFDVDENALSMAALYFDRLARRGGEHLLGI